MSVTQGPAKAASRSIVLAALVISIISLALGTYTLVSILTPAAPTAQSRTFRISIDFLNQTSGMASTTNRFTLDTITAYHGDTVILNVTNRAPAEHGFTINALGIGTIVASGTTYSVTAANVGAGVYTFYCHLHTAHLTGQLVVLRR